VPDPVDPVDHKVDRLAEFCVIVGMMDFIGDQ
jgi:hypothetical protein